MADRLRVISATMFYPRGGSSHAARAVVRGLRARGLDVALLAGSRSDLGPQSNARCFFGPETHAVSFDAALASGQPMRYEGPAGSAPMHASFEDRPGAPDRIFASLDDLDLERQVRAWARELALAGAAEADVLYLHHLTPLHEAAARVAPQVPVVAQLHGTELLMLEQIEAGRCSRWPQADRWAERLRLWAARCVRLIAVPAAVERAVRLLHAPPELIVPIPSGVDVELFRPHEPPAGREAFWQRTLVDQPQGWLPDREAGSVRYSAADARRLAEGTVLLHVGRFTAVKRIDLLIDAFARARRDARPPAGLVLVGGHPGEWEGEHPIQTIERLGVPDVFLAGWQPQEALPDFLAAADALVMSSEREQFGLVLIEAMACGVPVVATRSLGPASIVEPGRTGWLVDGGADSGPLAAAIGEAIADPAQRERVGRAGREAAVARFSWDGIAQRIAVVLEAAAGERPRRPATRVAG
jgi:glycosyltransferase involved in cell wall biosynthesis